MNKLNATIVCIGAGSIGSNFIKEFARFMSYYKNDDVNMKCIVIDDGIVERDDLYTHPYIDSDIGWSKAGVIIGAIKDNFYNIKDKVVGSNVRIKTSKKLSKIINDNKIRGYSYSNNICSNITYIIDTVGSSLTRNAAKECFMNESNAILINCSAFNIVGEIEISIRANDLLVCNDATIRKTRYKLPYYIKHISSLMCSHLLLGIICNSIANKKLNVGNIKFNTLQYFSRLNAEEIPEFKSKISKHDYEHFAVICVGTGGTGGNFVKEFARYMKGSKTSMSLVLVDGDKVEDHNRERQPFTHEDIQQNKAVVMVDTIKETLSFDDECVKAYPFFIDTVDQLHEAVMLGCKPGKKNKVFLLGCVDNHRARQVMEQYFNASADIIYVDSANEFSNGEVVIGIKENAQIVSPSRAFYFPDVLTDNSPSASELSCGEVNLSAPQHLVTNLFAAHFLLTILVKSIELNCIDNGIIYFDAFTYFSRFQSMALEVAA